MFNLELEFSVDGKLQSFNMLSINSGDDYHVRTYIDQKYTFTYGIEDFTIDKTGYVEA